MEKTRYWLGRTEIRPDINRVTLPESVVQLDIVAVEEPLFWAVDGREEAVAISRLQDRFRAGFPFSCF